MIKLYDQVPRVYSEASRDFQYLTWLFDIVLNSVKHNVDSMRELRTNQCDPRFAELLATTLGFKIRRNYDKQQLNALIHIIPQILKNKGNIQAIELAGNALIRAAGAVGRFNCVVENNNLSVTMPAELIDISLFTDLLPYILPAGMTCTVHRKTELVKASNTELAYADKLKAVPVYAQDLARLFDIQGKANTDNGNATYEIPYYNLPVDANGNPVRVCEANQNAEHPNKDNKAYLVHNGLMSNTIIPAFTDNNTLIIGQSPWADNISRNNDGSIDTIEQAPGGATKVEQNITEDE